MNRFRRCISVLLAAVMLASSAQAAIIPDALAESISTEVFSQILPQETLPALPELSTEADAPTEETPETPAEPDVPTEEMPETPAESDFIKLLHDSV